MSAHPNGESPTHAQKAHDAFCRFFAVGALGFVIDATVLGFLTHIAHWNAFFARIPSFVVAVAITWWVNRRYTFANRERRRTAIDAFWYTTIQFGGALANLAIFSIVLLLSQRLRTLPVIALSIGAVGGLAFNFSMTNFVLYKRNRVEPTR